jgi:hypothetical protein
MPGRISVVKRLVSGVAVKFKDVDVDDTGYQHVY